MSHSMRSGITHVFGWFTFSIAIWSTVSLFVLVERRSRKEIGSYKNFLRIYCAYAFWFALIDWLVQPAVAVDLYGFGYVFYSENRLFDLGYSIGHLVQIFYCGCFITSSSFLSLNFIYRYVSTCQKNFLKYFKRWYLIAWLLYCTVPFGIWSICVYIWMSPSDVITAHMNYTTTLYENFDLTDRPYVAVLCRYVYNSSDHLFGDVYWPTFLSLVGLFGFQIFFYGISLFCGILTYRANMELFRAARLSQHLYKMQMQLLKAIVIQAVIPLLSVYVPPAIIIGGGMAGVYVGQIGYFAVMSINTYPPLDSLVFLLSIRDYRDALFCKTVDGNFHSHSSVHQAVARPGTAKVSDITQRIEPTSQRIEIA